MGYAWSGVCYETPADALAAFSLSVPSADGSAINAFTAPPTVDGSGLISWSIHHRPMSGLLPSIQTGTTQLQPCDYNSLAALPLADLALVIATVICIALGFRMGQAT